ncbi:sodium-translocating pyrophosphatase [candidate division WOR-3 bacterium]|uniref:Putative K(+)-stimulated pyrophosphate-energized sodium pump n=1 Tax=candidate division WOR-3 bacterium TaxID=2052148 RepID=A0A660SEL3_UNCW3|nr:MAG: sodium-translocating pyrophosphatase [candidate division WOR-3 bacterium]
MANIFWLIPGSAILGVIFTLVLIRRIFSLSEGSDEMKRIATAVRIGARAYLNRQLRAIFIFFAIAFFLLIFLSFSGMLPTFVPYAFLTGGLFSALAGYIGMMVATGSSARTAHAARSSLNRALRVAFSAGSVMGLLVVALALLFLSIWFLFLNHYYHNLPLWERIQNITATLLCSGMGASAYALFARVGGGIYTKAADVGADLVGKVEAGIPEDDPRNPAVIADNVGDNVGDVAGMGADLYESYVGAIVASMALAFAGGLGMGGVLFPLVLSGIGIIASIIGTFFVQVGEEADQARLLWAIRRGIWISSAIVAVSSYFLAQYLLNNPSLFLPILLGLLAGNIIGFSSEYFTSDAYGPTRSIADATQTGPATTILQGMGVGMRSTVPPVLIVAATIILSFLLSGGGDDICLGLYGIGIAAVGMLSTLGITLATDAYGPVADNAGGNAQMAGLEPAVRERTDALDALGNTTAATGKGFAIGSAALTATALIAAYQERIVQLGGELSLSLIDPKVLVGLLIGAVMPFLFCSLILGAVSRTASRIVLEVRRQFREIEGLMEGKATPDYARAVDICTSSAQNEMLAPSLIAILVPIGVGILISADGVVGLLIGALITGFSMAIYMANAGGAWDNAKKYIEKGNLGGKGSDAHKAGVVGDTVGDPMKDAAGPSLNILIKLMSMVSIVFAALILKVAILK